MFFFDFDELEKEDPVNFHQAEVSSPVIIDELKAAKPVEEAAPHLSQGKFEEMSGELGNEDPVDFHQAEAPSPAITDEMEAAKSVENAASHHSQGKFKEMSDQHYRRVRELKEQRQREDDPEAWTSDEPRITYWHMLDDSPVAGGIPESGDQARYEEASHTPTLAPTTVMQDDTGVASESTLSDDSDVSIYGLCRIAHEVDKGDELSEPSSQDNGEMALITKKRVQRWRQENKLMNDHDFSQVFVDFDEAYHNAGRAVADAWSKAKIREEPDIVTDSAQAQRSRGNSH